MGLLLHFVLSLQNNRVSSQIIYSMSRHVPFPSSLICLGYYRYSNESWPCGWYILKSVQITCVIISILPLRWVILGQISFSLPSFFCLICPARSLQCQRPSWRDRYSSAQGNSTVQIFWKLVAFIRKAHLALRITELQSYWRGGYSAAWDCR